MYTMFQDVRYAFRKLLHAPGFTIIAVATIGIALGAATAMFSVVDGVLLKPLPYRAPQELVRVNSMGPNGVMPMSPLDFIDYRNESRSFAGMAAIDGTTMNLTTPGESPILLQVGRVSASFFRVLGVSAERGRVFAAGDDDRGAPNIVVLSDATWRSRFGGDAGIVGRTVSLNGSSYTVVGVAPAWLSIPQNANAWVPLQFSVNDLDPSNRGAHSLDGVARLAAGVSVDRASEDLGRVAAALATKYPDTNTGFGAGIVELQTQMVKDVRAALWTLFGAVAFVLLVACANVANLLLVRASTRETEIAVRTALGAGRGRIVRQLITESVLLAVMGAAVGVLLAHWIVSAVVAFGPKGLPRLDDIGVDGRVLVFAAGVALVTGVLFGLAPALHSAQADISGMLKAGTRGSGGRRGATRTRNAFVIAESALAVVLLVGAGLFLRSFAQMLAVDPGFRPAQVTTASVSLPSVKYPRDHDAGAFADRVLEQVRAQPGVQDAAVGFGRPLAASHIRLTFEVAGWPPSTPADRHVTWLRPVSADYFKVLGIPVVQGRAFTADDRADGRQVLIVSQAFVRQFFKGENPIGKHLTLSWGRDSSEWGANAAAGGDIVGVVGDVAEFGPTTTPAAWVYAPFAQLPVSDLSVLVRSRLPEAAVAKEVQAAVHRVDADLPVYDVAPMTRVLAASVAQPRFYTTLIMCFALVGLLLAAIGIYGVISYGVSVRAREIGIRIALGAPQRRVMQLTIRQGLVLALIGVPIGLAGAYLLRGYVRGELYAPSGPDVLPFAVVPVVLLAAAAVASYIPARRAARVDPAVAMRD